MKAVNRVFGKKAGVVAKSDTTEGTPARAQAPPAKDDDDDDDDLFGDAEEDEQKAEAVPAVEQNGNSVLNVASPAPALVSLPAATPTQGGQTPSSGAAPTLQPTPVPAAVPTGVPLPGQEAIAVSNTLAIPRKQHHAPDTAKIGQSNANLGTKYGLPPGVKIPRSVEEKALLHGKILEALRKIPVELMNESLTEYDDAVQIKGESIRNHAAYLFGVIKRYVDVQETRGEALVQASLAPSVQRKLDDLVRSGYCTKDEMDEKVRGKIRMLSERDALIALDELSSVDRSQIRNFGSYLMGIIVKRHRSAGGGGGSGGGGSGMADHIRDSNRSDSRSRRRDSSDDRNYRGSSKKDSYGRHDRERSRDRSDDRSRDDRDRRGGDQYRRDTDRDRSHYGPGQSNQGFIGQSPMGVTMQGQPPQAHPSMNSYSQQQPQYMHQPNQYGQPVNQQHQPQQFVPQMGSMPAQISQQQQMYAPNNQGYPPPQNQNYPPQNRQGPGQPHQNIMMQPAMGPGQGPTMQQTYGQHQQPPYALNQPVHQMMNQTPQQQPPYMQQTQMGGHPLHHQVPQGPDSYGSLQQPSSSGWQQPQVAGPYGSHHGQGQGSSWQQQQQPGQMPLDILGLADKAASAVQQLTGQNTGLGGPQPSYSGHAAPHYSSVVPPSSNPMQQVLPGSGIPYSNASMPPYNAAMAGNMNHQHNRDPQQGGGDPNRNNPRKGRATTTATLSELPVMVQYAVNVGSSDSHMFRSLNHTFSFTHCHILLVLFLPFAEFACNQAG
jgi:Heterogeneous nuclear ribonucleoprotein Q acidic domain